MPNVNLTNFEATIMRMVRDARNAGEPAHYHQRILDESGTREMKIIVERTIDPPSITCVIRVRRIL